MLRTMSPPPGIAQLWNFSVSGIEAHDGVRLGAGLVVPDRALGEDDAIGLGLRPARRRPLLHLAGREIKPAEIAAREIGVPDMSSSASWRDGAAGRPHPATILLIAIVSGSILAILLVPNSTNNGTPLELIGIP